MILESGHVFSADGGGDIDINGAAQGNDKITWRENNEASFIKHLIAMNHEYPYFFNSFDVEDDEDIDILSMGTQSVD